jgi:signal transduction histidine kinase
VFQDFNLIPDLNVYDNVDVPPLAGSPRFLLADEPTGNLDSVMARQVLELIDMFRGGQPLEGLAFASFVGEGPQPLRDAVECGRDALFSLDGETGEPEIVHLSQRRFALNGREHRLYLLKRLTCELTRQEVATWKKVIRVISHELNNSLAPISSLAHSGQLLAKAPDPARLETVFTTIAERAEHLKSFLDGYARFAKLPAPRGVDVEWAPFIESLREAARFTGPERLPERPDRFYPARIEQVDINIGKNARESGSPEDAVDLCLADDGRVTRLQVLDRGSGMSEQVLANALLPFYSTKRGHGARAEPESRDRRGPRRRPEPREPAGRRARGDAVAAAAGAMTATREGGAGLRAEVP